MRKITADLFISLDGVVEDPGDWHFPYYSSEDPSWRGGQRCAGRVGRDGHQATPAPYGLGIVEVIQQGSGRRG